MKTYLKFLYNLLFRSKRSYSQTGEDMVLDFFLNKVKKGFYVDVGTNDPVYINNTYLFYRKGWDGVCVEPNGLRCRMIKMWRRRDSVVQAGIGNSAGSLPFFVFEPDTISTFSASEAEEFKKLGHPLIKEESVPVMTLAELLSKHAQGRTIDILSVDTEGLDLEVLTSNDWTKYRPRLVVTEVVEYRKDHGKRTINQFDEFFQQHGYGKVADTYINAIYMDRAFAAENKIDLA